MKTPATTSARIANGASGAFRWIWIVAGAVGASVVALFLVYNFG